jgi:hypothetical protein
VAAKKRDYQALRWEEIIPASLALAEIIGQFAYALHFFDDKRNNPFCPA